MTSDKDDAELDSLLMFVTSQNLKTGKMAQL